MEVTARAQPEKQDNGMAGKRPANIFRKVERALLLAGAVLLSVFVIAHVHRVLMVRAEIARFNETREMAMEAGSAESMVQVEKSETASANKTPAQPENPAQPEKKDGFWPIKQLKRYTHKFEARVAPPLAVLRIPKLRLEIPVLEGTDDITLNRGVGHIQGTALPGAEW